MTLGKRLMKLEGKTLVEKKIIIVKYENELKELQFQKEIFKRLENESEKEFVARVRKEVSQKPERPLISILVGNF